MSALGCPYYHGGPDPGFLESYNNGPIVSCPMCNFEYDSPKAKRQREFAAAEAQRSSRENAHD